VATLAGTDPDVDGLTDYREQCLLYELSEGGVNDIWSDGTNRLPKADAMAGESFLRRVARGNELHHDRWRLVRPSQPRMDGPAYEDTDYDLLPDGWEVENNLDPRNRVGADGFYGDPDGDNLLNTQEYLGQDFQRATNAPFINGTGDETNPNEHNWRPTARISAPG